MDVKEFTRVKKNNEILYEYARFIPREDIVSTLKKKKFNQKCFQIEYVMQCNDEKLTYALFFYKNHRQIGAIFPHNPL
jgi:hypothetical protein